MIRHLKVRNFKALPHLETSQLMRAHPDGVAFSTDKVNVVVGPNGAGKSALLGGMCLETLTFFNSVSSLDDKYTSIGSGPYWERVGGQWSNDYVFLPGLECDTDKAPALYYRPGHIPGNHDGLTDAMMCGYSRQANRYAELTDKKSSGQQAAAILTDIKSVLSGDVSNIRYGYANWRFGTTPVEFERGTYYGPYDYQAEILKKLYGSVTPGALPLVLMDEPEQSLDAKAEALLWNLIASTDCSKVQVVVATHSLYPLMHSEQFNLIEAVPGYADEVRALL